MTNDLIAIIAEGGAETAILRLLIENRRLIFEPEDLYKGKIFSQRSAKAFAKELNLETSRKIHIYRVIDSRTERFVLPKVYDHKVSVIDTLYTRPEIEMLYVIDSGRYEEFQRSGIQKPSEFIKKLVKPKKPFKSQQVVTDYWAGRMDDLVSAIREYARMSVDDYAQTLAVLLKE